MKKKWFDQKTFWYQSLGRSSSSILKSFGLKMSYFFAHRSSRQLCWYTATVENVVHTEKFGCVFGRARDQSQGPVQLYSYVVQQCVRGQFSVPSIEQLSLAEHTTQNGQNKWTANLETTIFGLKMMVKSGLKIFILKSYVSLQSYCG